MEVREEALALELEAKGVAFIHAPGGHPSHGHQRICSDDEAAPSTGREAPGLIAMHRYLVVLLLPLHQQASHESNSITWHTWYATESSCKILQPSLASSGGQSFQHMYTAFFPGHMHLDACMGLCRACRRRALQLYFCRHEHCPD